jgi:hypothetical protein
VGGIVFDVNFGGVWGGDNILFFAQLLRNWWVEIIQAVIYSEGRIYQRYTL